MSTSVPGTPKLPFAPPRRRSSLAFSKTMESPKLQTGLDAIEMVTPEAGRQAPVSRSNIGKKRATGFSFTTPSVPPGHVTQLQKVFQAAKANLHLDMHFAASPGGSIDSRLPSSRRIQSEQTAQVEELCSTGQNWRYSTVPQPLAATSLDVREPFPDSSPELPAIVSGHPNADTQPVEPVSSGFVSPADDYETERREETELPVLPASSPPVCYDSDARISTRNHCSTPSQAQDADDLAHPMTALKVDNEQAPSDDDMEDSPTVEHLRRVSREGHSPDSDLSILPGSIFLSQTARAAAESARAKRGLLKHVPYTAEHDKKSRGPKIDCPDPTIHTVSTHCPDPMLHRHLPSVPCPDPFAHDRLETSQEFVTSTDGLSAFRHQSHDSRAPGFVRNPRHPIVSRATTLGSPMSFSRRTSVPQGIVSRSGNANFLSPPLKSGYRTSEKQGQSPALHGRGAQEEHSGREWLRGQGSYGPQPNAASGLYTFSTAAAKATGQSAAPDLRIRNSYRTDTLTPFVLPLGNHRGRGTMRTLPPQIFRDHYRKPAESRQSTRGGTSAQQGTRSISRHRFHDMQFRSSPPRPTQRYTPPQVTRKRGNEDLEMPDFEITEDGTAETLSFLTRSRISDESIQIDEDTRAAVRMSLYGSRSPECLQAQREGIKELSPNVNIWRKDVSRFLRYKKKRRPSYWDDDLREVQMSPAGRRGFASSPIVSKRSMVAELDTTTSRAESVIVDENDLVGEVERASAEFEQRMRGEVVQIAQSDAAELEA